jgi:FkbM family methyltransferase
MIRMLGLRTARKITCQLRRLRGTYPLVDAIRRKFCGSGTITINDFDGSISMEVDLAEHMGSRIFWFGYYSRDVLFAMDRLLKPGMTFLDVGANIGEVTLFAAKRVGPSGTVVAFEPVHCIASCCRTNVHLNDYEWVRVVELGVSDKSGFSPIYNQTEPAEDGFIHNGLSTLYSSEWRSARAGKIELITIDEFVAASRLTRIDGIKIDIEGGELAALRGAKKTLDRFRPWLILEIVEENCRWAGYSPGDIIDFLKTLRYEVRRVGRKGRLETLATFGHHQDVICVPLD